MNALASTTPLHFWDPLRRAIACGVVGTQHRSTRRVRFVTCPACIALARARPPDPGGRGAVQ